MLRLAPASGVELGASSVLLDISGRKVFELAFGPNDVRRLVPDVCFVGGTHGTGKIVIQR